MGCFNGNDVPCGEAIDIPMPGNRAQSAQVNQIEGRQAVADDAAPTPTAAAAP
jgi:hypothetical protein